MLANDDLLRAVCVTVDLSKTNRERAESAYPTVGSWLERPDSPLASASPNVFPQGSIPLGTAINPSNGAEFDVDAVLELDLARGSDPAEVMQRLYDRIAQHGVYGRKLEWLPRGVRLRYENSFHLDVLPARRRVHDDGAVSIPDGKGGWERTNPRAYKEWFNHRAYAVESKTAVRAMEDLPPWEEFDGKAPSKLVVQLLKRSRDVYFERGAWLPASMLLTTLVGLYSCRLNSVELGLASASESAVRLVGAPGEPVLENPVNAGENLARQLKDTTHADEFESWARWVQRRLEAFEAAQSLEERRRVLSELFGDTAAQNAVTAMGNAVVDSRQAGMLRYSSATGLGTSTGTTVRDHSFHGG